MEEHFVRAVHIKNQKLKPKEKEKLLEQEKKKGFKYIERIYVKLKQNYRNEILDILENILNSVDSVVL